MTNEEKILALLERMDQRLEYLEKLPQRTMLERIEALETDVALLKIAIHQHTKEIEELKKARCVSKLDTLEKS